MNLLLLLAILPFLNTFFKEEEKKADLLSLKKFLSKVIVLFKKLTPLLYLAILLRLYYIPKPYIFGNFEQEINFVFLVKKQNLNLLFLLNFIWIIFLYYSYRFLSFQINKNGPLTYVLFSFFIGCLTGLILSANIFTLLFFYSLITFGSYFLFRKILIKKQNIFSQIFTNILFIEAILLTLAICFTSILGNLGIFLENGIMDNISKASTMTLLILYLSALIFSIIMPLYLFYHDNFNFDSLASYIALPLFYGFAKIYTLVKIISEVFAITLFANLIEKLNFNIFGLIFLSGIVYLSVLLLFSRNFKAIFFYLFFMQLIFAIFAIFMFAFYDNSTIYLVLPNFILSLTLIFFTFFNLILYLKRAENKDLSGLFYDMKITVFLMFFALLSLLGLAPSLQMIQNYDLLKLCLKSSYFLPKVIFMVNFVSLTLFVIKIFYPMFMKTVEKMEVSTKEGQVNIVNKSEHDKILASKIDLGSSLMMPCLLLGIIIFVLPIIKIFYE